MYREEQFYRVFVGDTDVDLSGISNVSDIGTGVGDKLTGFTELSEDIMAEPKMSTGDGKLTLTLGNKTKKCDTSLVWVGKDDTVRASILEWEGKRKCVILVDTRTGFLQKANSQMLTINADGTGGTFFKLTIAGTCDGNMSEVYETKTLAVN